MARKATSAAIEAKEVSMRPAKQPVDIQQLGIGLVSSVPTTIGSGLPSTSCKAISTSKGAAAPLAIRPQSVGGNGNVPAAMAREARRLQSCMRRSARVCPGSRLLRIQQLSIGDNTRRCAVMANEARTAAVAHEAIAQVSSPLLFSSRASATQAVCLPRPQESEARCITCGVFGTSRKLPSPPSSHASAIAAAGLL